MRLVLVVSRFPQLSETFIASKFAGLVDAGWDLLHQDAGASPQGPDRVFFQPAGAGGHPAVGDAAHWRCLLYTSDAADQ